MSRTRAYVGVFSALAALTLLTVAAAHFKLGLAVGLTIAAFKASLVATFFMHLKGEGRFTRFVALFPLVIFLVLLLLVLPDFLGRPA